MLHIEPTTINLGTINFGKVYKFSYTLSNKTSSVIKILAFAPGCKSCTEVELEKETLLPGESTLLNTIFTPGSLGIANKSVSVVYSVSDIVKPEIVLKFKGVVVE